MQRQGRTLYQKAPSSDDDESNDDSSMSSSSASDRKNFGHQQPNNASELPSNAPSSFWLPGRYRRNVQSTSTDSMQCISNGTITVNINETNQTNETNEPDEDHLKDMYQRMLNMTVELIDDISLNLRPGNRVLTSYGKGTIIKKESLPTCNGKQDTVPSSYKVKLDWGGILYCPRPTFVHKLLSTEEYGQAMENLEEVRKLQLSIQSIEWGIKPQVDESCVACLFRKPEIHSSSRRKRSSYLWRSSSSASSMASDVPIATTKTQRCDVCGNPVCRKHKITMNAGDVEFFIMCVDCSNDLNQTELHLNPHHPQLLPNLQRLVLYYKRMRLQLCFCIPNFAELGHQLTYKQKRDGAISLGNSALGFVGAALGVAGAAAVLTPAGPAILLAAVATSATSGTFQSMHASYNRFLSSKTANQIADRCLGWHGLCLAILNALEMLRKDLIVEENDFRLDYLKKILDNKNNNEADTKPQSIEILNSLALNSFSTTRSAMTGVGVTSAMGASYSQAINSSLQGIPVVGAAFSVGCMAMDANNMAASVKLLTTPAQKAIALQGVEQSFMRHIPNSIVSTVAAIMKAVDGLHLQMAEQRQEDERALIEAELAGLGGSINMDSDSDIERELAGL